MNAFNLRIFPITSWTSDKAQDRKFEYSLQNSTSINEDIALIHQSLSCMLDDQSPLPSWIIPSSILDLMTKLHVSMDAILFHYVRRVLMDLFRSGIVIGPFRIGLKRVCVIVSRNVALTSQISISSSVSMLVALTSSTSPTTFLLDPYFVHKW